MKINKSTLRRLVQEQFDSVMGEDQGDVMRSAYFDALSKAGYKNHGTHWQELKRISDLAQKAKNPSRMIAFLAKKLVSIVPAAEENEGSKDYVIQIGKSLRKQAAALENHLKKKAAKKPDKATSPEDKARHQRQGLDSTRKWANVFATWSRYAVARETNGKGPSKADLLSLMKKEGVPPNVQKQLLGLSSKKTNVARKLLKIAPAEQ